MKQTRKIIISKGIILSFLSLLFAFCVWFLYIRKETPDDAQETDNYSQAVWESTEVPLPIIGGSTESYEKLAALFGENDILILPDKEKIDFASDLVYEYQKQGNEIVFYSIFTGSENMPQLFINVTALDNSYHSGTPSEVISYKGVEIERWGLTYSMHLNGGIYDVMSQDTERALEIVKDIVDLAEGS